MDSLIKHVKDETCTNGWMNKNGAQFRYYEKNVWYQLIELTPDLQSYISLPYGLITETCPVVVHGFVAYLIHNWGRSETEIYKEFYQLCLSGFKNREEKKPGSFKRDLNNEYYNLHIIEENARVAYSQKIAPYLTVDDSILIKQYVDSYFDFIRINYSKQSSKIVGGSITNNTSVALLALYYYWLQKAKVIPYFDGQAVSKDDAIKELLSSRGHKFSFSNFRNIFYAIGTNEGKDPLKESYLKRVIPLLEDYPTARDLAKNCLYSYEREVTKQKYK